MATPGTEAVQLKGSPIYHLSPTDSHVTLCGIDLQKDVQPYSVVRTFSINPDNVSPCHICRKVSQGKLTLPLRPVTEGDNVGVQANTRPNKKEKIMARKTTADVTDDINKAVAGQAAVKATKAEKPAKVAAVPTEADVAKLQATKEAANAAGDKPAAAAARRAIRAALKARGEYVPRESRPKKEKPAKTPKTEPTPAPTPAAKSKKSK